MNINLLNTELTENMTSAEKWLVEKSTVETLEDGTISLFFQGNCPSRMIAELHKVAKNFHFLQSGKYGSSHFRTGTKMSTKNYVTYKLDDWTKPAKEAGM